MRLFFTILLSVFYISLITAQLKTTVEKSRTGGNTTIVPPASKVGVQKNNDSTKTFDPITLTYQLDNANGLTVRNRAAQSGLPIYIQGKPTSILRNVSTPEGRALNFIDNASGLMRIDNASISFEVTKVDADDLGMTHVRMNQKYKGLPIYGAEVIYHEGKGDDFLNGRYEVIGVIDVNTSITSDHALEVAKSVGGEIKKVEMDRYGLFQMNMELSDLVIYPFEGSHRLAYHTVVYHSIIDKMEYFIDAKTGEILHSHTAMCKFHNHVDGHDATACLEGSEDRHTGEMMPPPDGPIVSSATDLFGSTKSINTYQVGSKFYLIDAVRSMFNSTSSSMPDDPSGVIWTIDAFNTSPENSNFNYDHVSATNSNFSGKQTGVSAHYNGGKAYDYFKNLHARESINGQGGNVIALINISDEDGSSLGNAFWNGIAMFYGNGDDSFKPLARGLDVAGHEMSHGVVQATANLTYQGESGALNESFADVFGAMIDREDWLIGEDVVNTSAFPSGALRSLQDPHNGAANGNFNGGWQPRVYSERFTGSQDNGGVHINSGIPNWAFFNFASASAVGKEKAEKVYYRALEKYLTKSSQFIDARLAVVQAATDLYGATVANAAKAAFDKVEVFDGSGTTTQTDVEVNPGTDLILFTTEDQDGLYIADGSGNLIFNPVTEQRPISKPSITDDGSEIIFVNGDKDLYYVRIDWMTNSVAEEGVITSNDKYRNAIFSRDGLKLAALTDANDNKMFVYDFEGQAGNTFELFNPTFTNGAATGDVLYADAMEFDYTGEYIMYDAVNRIKGSNGSNIDYWDISFIKVFNEDANTFTLGTDIQKLFGQLPDGVSIGNPTFSKNSDYIIAFDLLENSDFKVMASNIELNKTNTLFEPNDRPGYPSYSLDDDKVIFDAANSSNLAVIGAVNLQSSKIDPVANSAAVFLGFQSVGVKWGVWFGNGDRVISSNEEVQDVQGIFTLSPNPVSNFLQMDIEDVNLDATIEIADMMGRIWKRSDIKAHEKQLTMDVNALPSGQYVLKVYTSKQSYSKLFTKM